MVTRSPTPRWRKKQDVRIKRLVRAVEALYFAAYWHPDRSVDEAALWTAVRDAAGIKPGQTGERLGSDRSATRRSILEEAAKECEEIKIEASTEPGDWWNKACDVCATAIRTSNGSAAK